MTIIAHLALRTDLTIYRATDTGTILHSHMTRATVCIVHKKGRKEEVKIVLYGSPSYDARKRAL